MDKNLLSILVCPLCKQSLQYAKWQQELICRSDKLAFPIEKGIPMLLVDKARPLTQED